MEWQTEDALAAIKAIAICNCRTNANRKSPWLKLQSNLLAEGLRNHRLVYITGIKRGTERVGVREGDGGERHRL